MTPEEQIEQMTRAGLLAFAADMVDDMQQAVGIDWPPPSSPFQLPHRRTGNLQRGIHISELSQEGPLITVYIVSEAPYTQSLENGRPNMLPRPFLQPAIDEWLPRAPDYLQSAFDGAVISAPSTPQFSF